MNQDDPEKRIADLEHQLAEQTRYADLRPAHHAHETAFPAQTSGYERKSTRKAFGLVIILVALVFAFAVGVYFFIGGLQSEDAAAPRSVWLGVALLLPSVLIPVGWVIKVIARGKKDRAQRRPGTVELITFASSYFLGSGPRYMWKLMSEMQIHLDSGHTFRGSYYVYVDPWQWKKWWRRAFPPEPGRLARPFKSDQEAIDAIFHVGASLRCVYNPKNPDHVIVFPFAARGDRVEYNEHRAYGSDHVRFYSAT